MTDHANALEQNLTSCHTCYLLVTADTHRCPRCNTAVHARIPHSVQRTMALVATAAILYIPAMTLPIMRTVSLGTPMDSTVVGGVIVLWNMSSYPIAAIIFVASVFGDYYKRFVPVCYRQSVVLGNR